jgi:hypothetical protein
MLKYFITGIVLISFSSIAYGFSLEESQEERAHKFIGAGTVGLFLIAMPLFLIKESKGKNMKDYLLTEENIKKMQSKDSESKKSKSRKKN